VRCSAHRAKSGARPSAFTINEVSRLLSNNEGRQQFNRIVIPLENTVCCQLAWIQMHMAASNQGAFLQSRAANRLQNPAKAEWEVEAAYMPEPGLL
jgi:hypothetical protein